MDWRRVLAYITGTVDEELLLRNEYLAAENRILLEQLQGRLRLTDLQRKPLQKSAVPAAAKLTTHSDCVLTSVCRLAAVVNSRSAQPAETDRV